MEYKLIKQLKVIMYFNVYVPRYSNRRFKNTLINIKSDMKTTSLMKSKNLFALSLF